MRYSITDNQGWVPALGIQGRVLLRLQDVEYQRDKLGTNFVLVSANKLTEFLTLITNWRMLHAGNGAGAQFSYVVNLSYGVTDTFGVFAETYGGLNDFSSFFDGGVFYLLNKDLQLDLSAGWQSQDGISDWFVDGGVSWRFDWRG